MKTHVLVNIDHVRIYELCAASLYLYACIVTKERESPESEFALKMWHKAMSGVIDGYNPIDGSLKPS